MTDNDALTNTKKSNGSNIVPCGPPGSTSPNDNLHSSITTCCLLFSKKNFINFRFSSLMPYWLSLLSNL